MLTLKKMFIGVFLFLVLMPLSVCAAPFIVCDPYPATAAVTSFQLYFDGSGVAVNVTPTVDATGSFIHYDLVSIAVGTHTVKSRATNATGQSGDSNTATFTIAAPLPIPPAPTNVRVSPN